MASPDDSKKPSPRRRVLAAAIPVALVAALIAAHRPLAGVVVRRGAAGMGIELDFDHLEVGSGVVRLEGVRAWPRGVRGVRVNADRVRLATSWLSLTSADAEGVRVNVEGSAAERVIDLAAWSSDHQGTLRLRASASDVHVEVRARPEVPSWLSLAGGQLSSDGASARFTAASGSAFGVPTGQITVSFVTDASGITLEAGKRPGADAAVTAQLRTSAQPPSFSLDVRPIELASLGSALGLKLPAEGATAKGHLDLALHPSKIDGNIALELNGWIPPHPRELSGVLHGKRTSLQSKLAIAEDRASIKLDDLTVRAGDLTMKGAGTVTSAGDHAVVRADLSGPVACAQLARAVARDDVGGALGAIAGDLAGRALGGSAVLSVSVEADSRDLGAAKVKPSVGVGCQLRLPF